MSTFQDLLGRASSPSWCLDNERSALAPRLYAEEPSDQGSRIDRAIGPLSARRADLRVGCMEMSTIAETSIDGARLQAQGFGALGDGARLDLLRELQRGTRCVCELAPKLGMAPNLLSYHLRVLREAGLVDRTRVGRRVEYQVRVRSLEELTVALVRLAIGGDERDVGPASCELRSGGTT